MESGTVILLNGASSSGKTTIARALNDVMGYTYMYVAIDQFAQMLPRIPSPFWPPALSDAMRQTVVIFADAQLNVIVDTVIFSPDDLRAWVEALAAYRVLFAGVRCPLDILEQRERERDDRGDGLARRQYDAVHAHGLYDIEIDTSLCGPLECALAIKRHLDDDQSLVAFRQLKSQLAREGA